MTRPRVQYKRYESNWDPGKSIRLHVKALHQYEVLFFFWSISIYQNTTNTSKKNIWPLKDKSWETDSEQRAELVHLKLFCLYTVLCNKCDGGIGVHSDHDQSIQNWSEMITIQSFAWFRLGVMRNHWKKSQKLHYFSFNWTTF